MPIPLVLKPLEWIGSSRDDLRELPEETRRVFGYALHQAQLGRYDATAKRLTGEFAGLVEVVDDFDRNTYRAVYTVKLTGVVYVLHVFQKKASHGIATPARELAVIRARLRRARAHYAEHYGGEGDH
jgi:phage-related protein